jgi:heme oxygenase
MEPIAQIDLIQEVRAATRDQHERLEALLPLTCESLTREGYKETLQLFLGLFDTIEKALMKAELPDEIEFDRRLRSQLLERDLRYLGLREGEIRSIPRFSRLFRFSNTAYSLGVIYVLEGSRLGGQYVAKLLHDRLGLTQDEGCSFFSSHGFQIGVMWNKFCVVARKTVTTPNERKHFVQGAKSTFTSFEKWLARRHVPIS